jgi:hypothetical protein
VLKLILFGVFPQVYVYGTFGYRLEPSRFLAETDNIVRQESLCNELMVEKLEKMRYCGFEKASKAHYCIFKCA